MLGPGYSAQLNLDLLGQGNYSLLQLLLCSEVGRVGRDPEKLQMVQLRLREAGGQLVEIRFQPRFVATPTPGLLAVCMVLRPLSWSLVPLPAKVHNDSPCGVGKSSPALTGAAWPWDLAGAARGLSVGSGFSLLSGTHWPKEEAHMGSGQQVAVALETLWVPQHLLLPRILLFRTLHYSLCPHGESISPRHVDLVGAPLPVVEIVTWGFG